MPFSFSQKTSIAVFPAVKKHKPLNGMVFFFQVAGCKAASQIQKQSV